MANGKVKFSPDEKINYKYNLSVANGVTAPFTSSEDPAALNVMITIMNGAITQ
jgi:hypothetical protein